MSLRKLTAIVRCEKLLGVVQALQQLGVPGLSVSQLRGLGEYANFYADSVLVRHARIEIFATSERCNDVVMAILRSAHTGDTGDGIVAVETVDEVYRIRTGHRADADTL